MAAHSCAVFGAASRNSCVANCLPHLDVRAERSRVDAQVESPSTGGRLGRAVDGNRWNQIGRGVEMVRGAVVAALLAAAVLAVVSCGRNTNEPGSPLTTGPTEDSALTSAATEVQPLLQSSFADTFAGLELRHDVPVMVIYRKPDPRLDAEVTRAAPGVRVEFRDAKYTLVEMQAAGGRVLDDHEYWKGRGMTVSGVGPAVDGSGVEVTTVNEAGDFVGALHERYPDMSFSVREGGAVVPPVYTGPPPILERPTSGTTGR